MNHTSERTPRRRFLQAVPAFPAMATLATLEPAGVHAAAQAVSGLSDDEVARDERFWFSVQQAFSLDAARHPECGCLGPDAALRARGRHSWLWVYGALRDRAELQGLWVAPNVFTRPGDVMRLADEIARVARTGLMA